MSYSLRELPEAARRLIAEMGGHWSALDALRVSGGTPSARCIKGLIVDSHGGVKVVGVRDPCKDFIRIYEFTFMNHCYACRAGSARSEAEYCYRCRVRHSYRPRPVKYWSWRWGLAEAGIDFQLFDPEGA